MIANIVQGNANMIGKSSTPGKPEYRSATLPSKRKAIMQMDFSDDHFAKMTPQYRESVDDTHVDQVSYTVLSHYMIVFIVRGRPWGEFTEP